jgi:hypothetical protein
MRTDDTRGWLRLGDEAWELLRLVQRAALWALDVCAGHLSGANPIGQDRGAVAAQQPIGTITTGGEFSRRWNVDDRAGPRAILHDPEGLL